MREPGPRVGDARTGFERIMAAHADESRPPPLRRGGEDLRASSATGGGRDPSESASSRDAASGSRASAPGGAKPAGASAGGAPGGAPSRRAEVLAKARRELEISLHDIRAFQKAGDKEEAEAIAKERASWSDERRAEVEAEERAARKRFEDAHFATREDNPEGFLIDDGEGGRIRVPLDMDGMARWMREMQSERIPEPYRTHVPEHHRTSR